MKLKLTKTLIEALKEQGATSIAITKADARHGEEIVDHDDMTREEIMFLKQIVDNRENKREYLTLVRQLNQLSALLEGGDDKKYTNLEILASAIKEYVREKLPNFYVFSINGTQSVPYLVTSVKYSPPESRQDWYQPAFVTVSGKAIRRGDEVGMSITVHSRKGGWSPREVFTDNNYLPETPVLVEQWEKEVETYLACRDNLGEQYVLEGTADVRGEDRWSTRAVEMKRSGVPDRACMDDEVGYSKDSDLHTLTWQVGAKVVKKSKYSYEEEGEDDEDSNTPKPVQVKLPKHPYVVLFNLRLHEYVTVHINQITKYQYRRNLAELLILPPGHKNLINALVESGKVEGDDIIEGKGKGVIILASGPPGTGKTLTSEVTAESAKRPLYSVQCSQLGVNPSELEEELKGILNRAVRYQAILQIDEADVYIHARGKDIVQNAVVGVFLRLLEYYEGILFLTTNRETSVDDAIRSRCVAHIRYDLPTLEDSRELWKILSKQFAVTLTDEQITQILDERKLFPISGRSIKQLLRLGKVYQERLGREISPELFLELIAFQDVEADRKGSVDEDPA